MEQLTARYLLLYSSDGQNSNQNSILLMLIKIELFELLKAIIIMRLYSSSKTAVASAMPSPVVSAVPSTVSVLALATTNSVAKARTHTWLLLLALVNENTVLGLDTYFRV
jgi:hypothetical protein